jgi:hypothetical protein
MTMAMTRQGKAAATGFVTAKFSMGKSSMGKLFAGTVSEFAAMFALVFAKAVFAEAMFASVSAKSAIAAAAKTFPAGLKLVKPFAFGPLAFAIPPAPALARVPFSAFSLGRAACFVAPLTATTWTARLHLPSRSAFCAFPMTLASLRELLVIKIVRTTATGAGTIFIAIVLRDLIAATRAVIPPVDVVPVSTAFIPVRATFPIARIGSNIAPIVAPLVSQLVCSDLVWSPVPIHVGRELHQTGCRDPTEK